MEKNSQIYNIIAIVLLLIIAAGAFLYFRGNSTQGTAATSTSGVATTSQNGVTGTGDFTVGQVPSIDIPDFRAPIAFGADISAEVRAAVQRSADALAETLAKDPFDLAAWINLGIFRKAGGDYAGAEKAWIFVSQAAPTNEIAYHNLGDLYTNFYKKTTRSAEDILKKGIAAIPNTVDLRVMLARYYKMVGRTGDANAQYDLAISKAQAIGDKDLAAAIRAESGR